MVEWPLLAAALVVFNRLIARQSLREAAWFSVIALAIAMLLALGVR